MSDVAGVCGRPPPLGPWAYFVRAARPAGMWVCVGALAVGGVWLPIVTRTAPDWAGMTVYGGLLASLGALRSYDKKQGQAS